MPMTTQQIISIPFICGPSCGPVDFWPRVLAITCFLCSRLRRSLPAIRLDLPRADSPDRVMRRRKHVGDLALWLGPCSLFLQLFLPSRFDFRRTVLDRVLPCRPSAALRVEVILVEHALGVVRLVKLVVDRALRTFAGSAWE